MNHATARGLAYQEPATTAAEDFHWPHRPRILSCKRSKFIHERTRPQARILSRPSEEEGNVRRSRKQGWATIGDKHRAGEIFRPQRHRLAEVLPSPSHIRNLQWSVRQNTACESIHHRSREISSREISLAKLHLSRCRVNASQSPGKTRDALSLSASGIVSGTSGCRAKERLISSAGGGAIQSMPYSNRIRPIECSVPHDPAPRFRGDLLKPTAKRAQPHPSAH